MPSAAWTFPTGTPSSPQEVQFTLALAEATAASQVVLVSTQPGAPQAVGGGGGLFGLFGGGAKAPPPAVGKPLEQLAKLEQLVRLNLNSKSK